MTDIYILNTNYEFVGIVDNYSSAIFTRRYWEYGDFELYIKANSKSFKLLQPDYYVQRDGDTYIYIIESIQLTTSQEDGDFLTVKGRSAESILDRRILFNHRNITAIGFNTGGFVVNYPTDTTKTVEDCIRNAIEMTIAPTDLNPYGVKWAWDGNFVLGERQGFTETISQMEIIGTNLYNFISEQCQLNGYGFRVHLNQDKKFEFNLYKGRDCSYNQDENPYIAFSPQFDNLLNTTYQFDKSNLKTYVIGFGCGDIADEKLWTYYPTTTTKIDNNNYINRRELFVDCSGVSNKRKNAYGEEEQMADNLYSMYVSQNASNELLKYSWSETFDGDIVSNTGYSLGDIVQIENEYEIQATARILEITECEDESGYSTILTFSTWEV